MRVASLVIKEKRNNFIKADAKVEVEGEKSYAIVDDVMLHRETVEDILRQIKKQTQTRIDDGSIIYSELTPAEHYKQQEAKKVPQKPVVTVGFVDGKAQIVSAAPTAVNLGDKLRSKMAEPVTVEHGVPIKVSELPKVVEIEPIKVEPVKVEPVVKPMGFFARLIAAFKMLFGG